MKLQFSIRDLQWLTLLVAVLTAWWIDHERLSNPWSELSGPATIEGLPHISCYFDDEVSADAHAKDNPQQP